MSKIKILRIINRFNIGGPTYNAAYLSKYLPSDKYETLLLGGIKDKGEDSSEFILESLNLKPILIKDMKRSIDLINDLKSLREIKKIIREYKPDIVHTHASKAGFIGRIAAYQCKVPIIVHTFHGHVFHSYFNRSKTTIFKSIERYLAKKSTKIIAISKEQKNELCSIHRICPSDKIEIIPLGFDLTRFTENQIEKRQSFRNTYGIDAHTICVGIIGRLTAIKNHHFFIDAIHNVLKHQLKNTVKFFIIGDGELRSELENYCQEKSLSISTPENNNPNASVIFTSWIKEVDWALAGLDIVALTSKNEGTPVSLIEAQAAGKAVISTNVGGVKDIVNENISGLLSAPNDIDTFTKNLLLLIEDNDLRTKMSTSGKDITIKSFSYQRLITDIDGLYTQLLQKTQK
jgi:glycosyltransferase involved in cell wall biosynthesis